MAPQTKLFTFALPAQLKAALQAIKDRDGISEAEQIRRGIQMWIASREVGETLSRQRATRRKTKQLDG
jgi:hypothetical protein